MLDGIVALMSHRLTTNTSITQKVALRPEGDLRLAETTVPEYVPGDQIRFRIEFGHKANIKKVVATCAYQGETKTNLREFTIPGKITHQVLERGYKHSTAHFTSDEVPSNVAPGGEYRVVRVFLESYLGTRMSLAHLPDIRFQISSGEPAGNPESIGFEWP